MRLPFQIALRFLKSGKFQTLMIIIGIAVGVSVQVFIGSLITRFATKSRRPDNRIVVANHRSSP
ncbi:MAG: hypothetical protein MZU97_18195 [Bacillus subtilis]|nr:hypothetical protein [Bacillus subtilis]